MSDKPVYRDESRIRHMCNALAKIAEKSCGIERKDLVEGGTILSLSFII